MTVPRRLELEEFSADLAAALQPRVKRLGYLGEFFKCAAHQPATLVAFIEFTEASKQGLPDRLVEVIALTCAGVMGNAYERNQHERLCVRLGFGADWVAAVNALAPDAPSAMQDEERLVQHFVMVALDSRGHEAAELFEPLAAIVGEAGAIAVLMVLGRYVVHALIVNALGLQPPVPSIFEDAFIG